MTDRPAPCPCGCAYPPESCAREGFLRLDGVPEGVFNMFGPWKGFRRPKPICECRLWGEHDCTSPATMQDGAGFWFCSLCGPSRGGEDALKEGQVKDSD